MSIRKTSILAFGLCLLISARAFGSEGMWENNGLKICNAGDNQYSPQLVSDNAGGAIIVWQDNRGADSDIYAQRVDSNGVVHAGWPDNGVKICNAGDNQYSPQLVSDNAGGVIIVWYDRRDSNYDIYAQRVESDGNIAWTNNGVKICNAGGWQGGLQIVSDDSGGAIIVWETIGFDIYAQRVDSDGSIHTGWPANGVTICNAGAEQYSPQMVSDNSGGAIILWSDDRDFGISGPDIYAQKVDSDGSIHSGWTNNGVKICNAGDYQRSPQLVSDNFGGAIIVWRDWRDFMLPQGIYIYIYAQKVDSDGSIHSGWPNNGVKICGVGDVETYPELVLDDSGGVIIVWTNSPNYISDKLDIYAQRLDHDGAIHAGWPASGVAICNAAEEQSFMQLVSDNAGGAIIVWKDYRDSGTTGSDIYAQRLDSNGNIQTGWTNNGVKICNAGGNQDYHQMVPDNSGGVIIVWRDNRDSVTTGYDIYAQKIVRLKPKIISLSPGQAPWGKIANMTITGNSFVDDQGTVSYAKLTRTGQDDIEDNNPVILSSTSLTCNFDLRPFTATGDWYVVLYDSTGQTGTSAGVLFEVTQPQMNKLSWQDASGADINTGSKNNLVGQLNCEANGSDYLQSLRVENVGTAVVGDDISKLSLWHGSGGVSFDALKATGQAVGSFASVGESKTIWEIAFSSGSELEVNNGDVLYLAADINGGAQIGNTCQFYVAKGNAKFRYADMLGDTLPAEVLLSGTKQSIARNVSLQGDVVSLVPANVTKGQSNVLLGRFELSNVSTGTVPLDSLLLSLRDKAGNEQNLETVFTQIWLEQSGGKVTAPYSGKVLTFSPAWALLAQNQTTFDLKCDIKFSPNLAGFEIGLPHNLCINSGQCLIEPVSGREFPLLIKQVNIREPALKSVFSNYPNPFQPGKTKTHIPYYLKQPGQVKITVMTLSGEQVLVIENSNQTAGMHEAAWDGRNENGHGARSGIYLLCIEVHYTDGTNERLVRKVAVVK